VRCGRLYIQPAFGSTPNTPTSKIHHAGGIHNFKIHANILKNLIYFKLGHYLAILEVDGIADWQQCFEHDD
jgi:hypothetical protein